MLVWNGIPYAQSSGLHILADSTQALTDNVLHYLGITAPYSAVSEELEAHHAVRMARFTGPHEHSSPKEEVIMELGKLKGAGTWCDTLRR
jgi:hypothetical protein